MSDHEATPTDDDAARTDDADGSSATASDAKTDAEAMPPVAFVWGLRVVALCGLGIALFLSWVHVDAWMTETMAKAPGCAPSGLVDCNTVLNSPRWSTWFGLPVVFPALLVYAVINAGAWAISINRSRTDMRRVWFVLYTGAATVASAAVWFAYVQIAVIGRVCTWCMAEHVIGVTLALLIWLCGGAQLGLDGRRRLTAAGIGLLGVGVLVGGQMMQSPRYTEPVSIGRFEFKRGEHPVAGLANAPHMIVEALDYSCPRCRRLYGMLHYAQLKLGPDYAITVLTFPISSECNPLYESTEPMHSNACQLARLAHAVWLADPNRFEELHAFLFVNQPEMTIEKARAFAVTLVGEASLDRALKEVDERGLIKRDVDRAAEMGVRSLPGIFAGNVRFRALPEDPDVLADLIRDAFERKAVRDELGPARPPAEP
ncbi:MAG: thioredoxin domain-containing protein [Phycisphaera sp.]|nr:thioredoxin domain-containing protein [Phycisphaera sp.]